jgi:hypothetical protein
VLNYASVATLMGRKTLMDYQQDQFAVGDKPEAAIHRLLKAGLVRRTVGKSVYQNVTGTYIGDYCCANLLLTIAVRPGTPLIDAIYKYNNDKEEHVSGSLDGDGRVSMVIYGRRATTYHVERSNRGIGLIADKEPGDHNNYSPWFCQTCTGNAFELQT